MHITHLEAMLFDLDGTLLDTAPTFINVLNTLLKKHGKLPLTDALIREKVSHGARALITLGFGLSEDHENFETLRNELLDLYASNISEGTQLFSGMDKVLKALKEKNIPWGIITNKPSRFTFPLLTALGISDDCAVVVCPDDVSNTKPDPEPLHLACFRLNVEASNCIYVGDHERDIAAGNAAGMFTVSALFGYIANDDNPNTWQANLAVKHANELLALIP